MSGATKTRNELHNELEVLRARVKELERAAAKHERTEEALRESEERFRQITENSGQVFWLTDWKTRQPLYVSPSYESVYDRPLQTIHDDRRSWIQAVHPEDRDRIDRIFAEKGERGEPTDEKYRIVRQDGTIRWIHDRSIPVVDEGGDVYRWVSVAEDITERKRAENEIKESEARFRQIAENVGEVFFLSDARDDSAIYVSPGFEKIWGRPVESLHADAQSWQEAVHPEDRERVAAVLAKHDRGRKSFTNDYRIVRPDGTIRWVHDVVRPVRDDAGDVYRVVGVTTDVTERRRAEEALRQSEEKLRNIVEHSSELFYSHTCDHELTYMSPQTRQFLDCEPEEAMGRWMEFTTDNPINEIGFERTTRAIDTGEVQPPYELELVGKKGRKLWVEVHEAPIVEGGKTVAVVGALTDITERKRAEEALKRERRFTDLLVNGSVDGILAFDRELRYTVWNPGMERISGASRAETVGRRAFDVFPFLRETGEDKYFEAALAGETVVATDRPYTVPESGKEGFFEGHYGPLRDESGEIIGGLGIIREITERKQAEEGLRRAERIVSSSNDMLALLDLDYVYLAANEAYLRAFGKTHGELIGHSAEEVFGQEFFDTTIRPNAERCMAGEEVRYEDWFDFPASGRQYMDIAYSPYVGADEQTRGFVVCGRNATERKRGEKAVRDREQFLASVFESIQDGISVLNPDLTIRRVNGVMKEWYAGNLPLEGKKCYVCYHNADHACDPCPTLRCLRSHRTEREVVPGLPGSPVEWVELFSYPIIDQESGDVTSVVEFVRDITESRRAEEALRESEERLRQMANTIEDVFWITDWSDKRVIFASYAYETVWGIPLQDLYDDPENWAKAIHPDDSDRAWRNFLQLEAGEVYDEEYRITRPDGETRWIRDRGFPIRDAQGRVHRVAGVAQDITARKRVEETLREREEMIRALVETSQDWIWSIDREGVHTYSNPAIEAILGYSPDELVGKWSLGLIHDDDRKIVAGKLPKWLAEGSGWRNLLLRWRHKNGTYRYLESSAVPILHHRGELAGFRGVDRDVTERKLAEDQLLEKDYIIQSASSAIGTADLEGRVTYVNPAFLRIWGFDDPREVLGRPFPEFWEVQGRFDEIMTVLREQGAWDSEIRAKRKDGSHFDVQISAAMVHDKEGNPVSLMSSSVDITDRRRAERALRESEMKSRALLEGSPVCNKIIDLDSRLQYMSAAGQERLKIKDVESLYGCTFPLDFYPEATRTSLIEHLERAKAGEVCSLEGPVLDADGREVWYHTTFVPARDEGGRVEYVIASSVDITERKRAEEEQKSLELQLLQSQKMEAVGQLAGGVAHDFNNVLTAILGNTELLLSVAAEGSPGSSRELITRGLEQIKSAGERAAALTRRLLAFGGRRSLGREVLQTRQIVADTEKMLRQLIPEDITLDVALDPNTSHVFMDSGQIEQILMNLVLNARDAVGTGGVIRVTCHNETLSETEVAGHPDTKPGPHIVMCVTDNGTGMDKETLGRVFEPFFTTKPIGRGTGLGLAAVYGAVRQAGGHIEVTSEVGEGTTFRVFLPAVEGEITADGAPTAPHGSRGHEVILVCEDEELVRKVLCTVLRDAGYTVLAARNGEEALTVASGWRERVDLLITDVVMPGMNGRELADAFTGRYPGVRVVLVSGYTAEIVADEDSISNDAEFLQKPFSPDVLLERVRTVLDFERT